MMGKGLRWALGLTLLATAAAAWLPDDAADTSTALAQPARTRAAAGAGLDETARPAVPRPAVRAATPSAGEAAVWPAGPRPREAAEWPPVGPALQAAWAAERPPAPAAPSRPAPMPVAPPPVPQPAPLPPAVVLPPPPYTMIGRIEDGGQPMALLMGAQQTLLVRAGDTVDGRWRVQTVHAQGVTLLPLGPGAPATLSFKPT